MAKDGPLTALELPNIKHLRTLWEQKKKRWVYGKVELVEKKWLIYYDPDFVYDILNLLSRKIDEIENLRSKQ